MPDPEKKRPYCQDCFWLGWRDEIRKDEGPVGVPHCDHPDNIYDDAMWDGNWYAPAIEVGRVYKSSPSEINRYNDCPRFRKKEHSSYPWELKAGALEMAEKE